MFLKRNNKGQALVEFVILLPIIIMILFVIIDFSFVFYNKNNLEGVINNVVIYSQKGKSYDEIKKILDSDVKLSYVYQEETIIIKVEKDVNLITPFASSFFSNPYKITAERVVLNE